MEGIVAPETPQRSRNFNVGDLVHVYNGTGAGTRGYKTIAYMGTVVGYDVEQSKWLVCGVLLFCFSLTCLTFFSGCLLSRLETAWWQKKGNPTGLRKRSCPGLEPYNFFPSLLFSSLLFSSLLFSSLLFSSLFFSFLFFSSLLLSSILFSSLL